MSDEIESEARRNSASDRRDVGVNDRGTRIRCSRRFISRFDEKSFVRKTKRKEKGKLSSQRLVGGSGRYGGVMEETQVNNLTG